MNKLLQNTLISIVAAASVSACSKDSKPEDTAVPEPVETAQTTGRENTHESESPAKGEHFAKGMMLAYEDCRARLADDSAEGIAECANAIVEASHSSHASAPAAAHEHIGSVVEAAKALAASPAGDIDVVRLRFGELSKSIVAMLTSAPEAAKNYHVFECPMAKGYKRWAQPTAELANPYMGAKMLTCGSEVHDHHEGVVKDDSDGHEGHTGHSH